MSIETTDYTIGATADVQDLRSECKTDGIPDSYLEKNLREIEALISFGAYDQANDVLEDNLRESHGHLGVFHLYNAVLCSIFEDPKEGLDSCGRALKELKELNDINTSSFSRDSIPHGYIFLVQAALHLQNKSSGSALRSINKALNVHNLPEFIAFRALVYYSRSELDKAFKDAEEALKRGLRTPLLGVDLIRLGNELYGLKAFVESKNNLDFSENWKKGECSNLFKCHEGKIIQNLGSSEGITNLLLC